MSILLLDLSVFAMGYSFAKLYTLRTAQKLNRISNMLILCAVRRYFATIADSFPSVLGGDAI
jgi:hypothetical protein